MHTTQNILTILSLLYIAYRAGNMYLAARSLLNNGENIAVKWESLAVRWFFPLIVVWSVFGAVAVVVNMFN